MRNFTRWTRRFLAMMLDRTEAATDRQAGILQTPLRREGTTQSYAQWLPFLLFPDRAARSADPRSYAAIRVPTALIWGREDSVTPLPQGQRLRAMIAGSSLDIVDGAGHIPHIETPDKLVGVLADRLNALRSRQHYRLRVPCRNSSTHFRAAPSSAFFRRGNVVAALLHSARTASAATSTSRSARHSPRSTPWMKIFFHS